LDLGMPGLSGDETCRRIKSSDVLRGIPVLMLTAHEDHQSMIEGMNAGADDYIAKSADAAVLAARLRAHIRRKHLAVEAQRMREQAIRRETDAQASRELAETRAKLLA